jgi:hypothetical protein
LFREEKRVKKRKKVVKSKLSFAQEDDEGEDAEKEEDIDGVFYWTIRVLGTDVRFGFIHEFPTMINNGLSNLQLHQNHRPNEPRK